MKLQRLKSSLHTLTEDLICLSRTAIGTNIINTRQEVVSHTIKKKLWKTLPRHDEFCKNGCNSTMHTIMDFLYDLRFRGRQLKAFIRGCCAGFCAGILKVRWKEIWTSQKHRNTDINTQLHLPWCCTTKCKCKDKREAEADYPSTHVPNFIEADTLMPLMIFSPVVLCPVSVVCLESCQIQAHIGSHPICVAGKLAIKATSELLYLLWSDSRYTAL